MMDTLRVKTCRMCKQVKELTEFSPDKRGKDGLALHCKECRALKAREITAGGKSKDIVRRHKVMKIARRLADGETLTDAYHSLGTTSSKEVAASCASTFLKKLDDDDMELFRKMLTPEPIMKGIQAFFHDVLTRSMPVTIDEYNKTLMSWGRFAGTYAPEKRETTTTTTTVSAEQSMTTLEHVAELLKKEEGE